MRGDIDDPFHRFIELAFRCGRFSDEELMAYAETIALQRQFEAANGRLLQRVQTQMWSLGIVIPPKHRAVIAFADWFPLSATAYLPDLIQFAMMTLRELQESGYPAWPLVTDEEFQPPPIDEDEAAAYRRYKAAAAEWRGTTEARQRLAAAMVDHARIVYRPRRRDESDVERLKLWTRVMDDALASVVARLQQSRLFLDIDALDALRKALPGSVQIGSRETWHRACREIGSGTTTYLLLSVHWQIWRRRMGRQDAEAASARPPIPDGAGGENVSHGAAS